MPSPINAQSPPDHLELEQLRVLELPEEFVPTGANFDSDGGVTIWSDHGIAVVDADYRVRVIRHPLVQAPLAVRFDPEHQTIEVVDASAGIVSLDSSGRLLAREPLPSMATLIQAVPSRGGWVFLAADGDSQELWVHDPTARPVQVWTSSAAMMDADLSPATNLRLSAITDGSVVLGEVNYPFRAWRVQVGDAAENHGLGLLPGTETIAGLLRKHGLPADRSVALPVVPLDDGYLAQLSDLTEDRRLLVVLDADGELIRENIVTVPIGFIATDTERRRMVAVRDIAGLETALYQWRWSGSR